MECYFLCTAAIAQDVDCRFLVIFTFRVVVCSVATRTYITVLEASVIKIVNGYNIWGGLVSE